VRGIVLVALGAFAATVAGGAPAAREQATWGFAEGRLLARDGTPIPGAFVNYVPRFRPRHGLEDVAIFTRSDGRYVTVPLDPGRWRITMSLDSRRIASRVVRVRATDVELLGGPRFVGTHADVVAPEFTRAPRGLAETATAYERTLSGDTRRRIRVAPVATAGAYAATHVSFESAEPIGYGTTTMLIRQTGGRWRVVAAADDGRLDCAAAPRTVMRTLFGWCRSSGRGRAATIAP
jgi:hypothetical protein